MADEPVPESDDPPELPGGELFADIGARCIEPEVARRREQGSMEADDLVWCYHVLLPPGQSPPGLDTFEAFITAGLGAVKSPDRQAAQHSK